MDDDRLLRIAAADRALGERAQVAFLHALEKGNAFQIGRHD
jgi:hypothetical protein